jgi:hypothetical protein
MKSSHPVRCLVVVAGLGSCVPSRTSHWSGRPTPQAVCGFFGIVTGGPLLTASVAMIDATVVPKGLINPTCGATVASIIFIF